MRNKIQDLRNILFEQMERLMDDDADLATETKRAESIAQIASVLVQSAKVEVDFLRMVGAEGSGTGFIPMDNQKQIG
jgi:hypothetical protein